MTHNRPSAVSVLTPRQARPDGRPPPPTDKVTQAPSKRCAIDPAPAANLPAFERALLDAAGPEPVLRLLQTMSPQPVAMVAWSQWPHEPRCWAMAGDPAAAVELATRAVDTRRGGGQAPAGTRGLCHDGDSAAVLLGEGLEALDTDQLDAIAQRMAELLTARRLRGAVARLAHAEKLQHALFAIADMAGSNRDMPTLLRGLHGIIGGLMYAENFYIAMFSNQRQSVRFIYFADEYNDERYSPTEDVPIDRLERGLTWYVLHDCVPLRGALERLREQISGPLHARGARSFDWLGVPMLRDGLAVGALVVQSYREDVEPYSAADSAVLAFVAEHVLNAVERKQSQETLESHVAERTRQLAQINADLQKQVVERLRAEHLQAALYRIAALATSDEDDSVRFYQQVHHTVGELINTDNFYIALLDDTRTHLHFPYSVDDKDAGRKPRRLGRGLSEYVIRHGKPLLADARDVEALVACGELERAGSTGAESLSWLGAPLCVDDEIIGLVAVQSYRPDVIYDAGDAELLNFVSSQIAHSLQRRRAAETLRTLNAELEARVEARTRELSEQIAVREHVEAQLKHQVMHDPLTGLPNRLYLRERLESALAQLQHNPTRRVSLLYLDVDRFKLFNDSLGHLAGDDVLREVARRLATCVRAPDLVARLSGDEFAILLEDTSGPRAACKVAQRVLDLFAEPMQIAGRLLQGSTSIGIAIGDARYQHIDALLHDADVALYRAKSGGRARFVMFDETLQRAAMDVLELEHELRAALIRNEFEPFFQPLVRLEDGEIVGYEALIRWRHPTRGLLVPGEFLGVAEESGLIEAIDWQMYRLACEAAVGFVRNDEFITLNISPRHFQNEDFDTRLLAMVEASGFEPSRLHIEVTEGTLLGEPDAVARILERLRVAGVEAALDDFGTGYSSLSYVHRFPLKMIKIDRSFIDPLGGDAAQRSSVIIGAILALSHSLGLDVLAEGIETEAQSTHLQRMGCLYGQGYHFGRPQPAAHWDRHAMMRA